MRPAVLPMIVVALLAGCMQSNTASRAGQTAPVQTTSMPARADTEIRPRTYPPQTNTPPVGWVAPQPAPAAAAQAAGQSDAARPAAPGAAGSASAAPVVAQASMAKPAASAAARPAGSTPQTMEMANPPIPAGYVPSVGPRPDRANAANTGAMAAPKATPGQWHAHLASHRTEEAAIQDWQRRLKNNMKAYGELEPGLIWVDLPGRGSFARLVVGEFANRAEAEALCARLRGPAQYCTPQPN